MATFVTVIHILVALILIGLVLVQDTKSSAAGGLMGGGGGSSSLLGATGAISLAAKMTRWAAVIFAVTSIALSVLSSRSGSSVIDGFAPTEMSQTTDVTTGSAPASPEAGATQPATPAGSASESNK